jgi:hypothetical protein
MADKKISALTAASTPLGGTEVVPLVQSSTTKNVSIANLTAGRAVSAASLSTTGNIVSDTLLRVTGAGQIEQNGGNGGLYFLNIPVGGGASNMRFLTTNGSGAAQLQLQLAGGTNQINNLYGDTRLETGNLLVGGGTLPTASGTGSPKILMLNDMLVISGRASIPSPYTQNLQIDIVWGNWGGNPVLTLVDLAVAMRQYASTSGAAFGKILATNSANDAVLDTFTTTDITASRCTVTASSGGNYTLRVTINPTGDTDAIGYTITIPTSSGATGSAVTSVTASLV